MERRGFDNMYVNQAPPKVTGKFPTDPPEARNNWCQLARQGNRNPTGGTDMAPWAHSADQPSLG